MFVFIMKNLYVQVMSAWGGIDFFLFIIFIIIIASLACSPRRGYIEKTNSLLDLIDLHLSRSHAVMHLFIFFTLIIGHRGSLMTL